MKIYKLKYNEVKRYASNFAINTIKQQIQELVLPNFNDWDVTVTRYYDSESWPNNLQYEIKFYNKVTECYIERLRNSFTEHYFRKYVYDFSKENILTKAQVKEYIDHLSGEPSRIDQLRLYYNDDNYYWRLSFDPNNAIYDWYLRVWRNEYCVYNDRIMFERGLEILDVHESSDLCESSQASETSESDVEKVVNDARSNDPVWYLSKRQLRDYYDNMSSYSRKVETAIHDYDNYCVRIEKNDDVYTLIIDKMQPDIMRNFYVATIDRHMFNTILGINPDDYDCDCDSDAEEIDDDEEELCEEESVSNEDEARVEDRPMSEDTDSLFKVVNGQLRRILLRNEFNRFKRNLFYRNYKVDEIYDNYDNFNVYIIKDRLSHYSIIADRLNLYCPVYFKDGFDGDECLAHYFGQSFVNKFNEEYERHNRNINTSDESVYRLSIDEFKKYVDYLFPLNASLLNDVLDNYYTTYTAIINKNTAPTYTYRLSISGGLITYFDNIHERIMPTIFGEDTAHKIEEYFNNLHCTELVGRALDNLRVSTANSYGNDVRVHDPYRRYVTKDEFGRYASHSFNIFYRSQIDNILNHYENYIVYISKEPTPVGNSYKLNVIDRSTNELFYWDGFSDVALENCFGFDVARDAATLDPVRTSSGSIADEIQPGRHLATFSNDSISHTSRELFAAHYMQNPTTLAITDDIPTSNNAGEEEPVSDEIRTIDQLVVALDKLRQQRVVQLDEHNVAYASNMNRHEQYDYDDSVFNDNLLVNIDNLINSLNRMREHEEV